MAPSPPELLPNPDPLPPWRPLLRVRTLVIRGWGGPAELVLLTDSRSSKSAELQAEPGVELCWLLPKARSQFRLRGERLAREAGGLIKRG
jgi:hypothetical protein